jgi:hypothetical protein
MIGSLGSSSKRQVWLGSCRPITQSRVGMTNELSPIQREAFTAIRLYFGLNEQDDMSKLRNYCMGLAVNDALKIIEECND